MENSSGNGRRMAKLSFETSYLAAEFCIKGNAIAWSVCVEHDKGLEILVLF